jgi:hypothetical protein
MLHEVDGGIRMTRLERRSRKRGGTTVIAGVSVSFFRVFPGLRAGGTLQADGVLVVRRAATTLSACP